MVDDSNELIIHLINYFACIMCVCALYLWEKNGERDASTRRRRSNSDREKE